MLYYKGLTKILSALLAFLMTLQVANAQTGPVVKLEKAQIITDSRGISEEIELALLVQSEIIVGYITLFYRSEPYKSYQTVRLARDQNLLYVGKLPMSPSIEYYIEITPERGQSIIIGAPTTPFMLETASLSKSKVASKTMKGGWFSKIIPILTVVVAILAVGRAERR